MQPCIREVVLVGLVLHHQKIKIIYITKMINLKQAEYDASFVTCSGGSHKNVVRGPCCNG